MKLVIDCRMIGMGGIGTYIRNLLPRIIDCGKFEVTCMGYAELKTEPWFSRVRFIEMKSPILSLKEQLELFLKVPRCDIFWSPNWNVPLLPVRARKRIVTIHDVYHLAHKKEFSAPKIAVVKMLLGKAQRSASTVITVSEFSRGEIIKYTGCKPGKIRVIHLGIDHSAVKADPPAINDRYVLYVGNVKPHKNLLLALKAFNMVNDGSLKFYIIGKKEGFITGYDNLAQIIADNREHVVFTGYVSDEALASYYAGADVFLFPSKYEGFGLPVLEAMKRHLKVIASNAASIPEVAGSAICYFDPYSEQDLAEKLRTVLGGGFEFDFSEYDLQLKKYNWANAAESHIAAFSE